MKTRHQTLRTLWCRHDPAQANADIFFKLPADFTVPRHWHTSAERMVLVSGEMQVTYDGHETTELKPGSYAYGPAKLPHSAYCSSALDEESIKRFCKTKAPQGVPAAASEHNDAGRSAKSEKLKFTRSTS